MKIERVNIVIPRDMNKHIKYLNNEVMDIHSHIRTGGVYKMDRIELNGVPEDILVLFNNKNIKYVKN